MADVSLLDYGESAFDLVDDEFLTLIGASEYNVPIDMNDYSYTLFDSDQLPWADIDPALFANPSCPITSSDINESTGLNIDQGSAGQINSPELTRLSGLAESNSNSPLCVVDFSASGANQTRKGLEACLFEFEGTKLKNTSKKGRKPFSKERRREVGQVRKAGACSRCRITKTPCKLELPCASCLKLCKGSSKLGKSLCHRQKLLDTRFTIDLWDRCGDLKWLQKNVTALHGPKRTLKISLVNPCDFAVRSVPNDLDPNDPLPWKGGYDDSWSETSVLELEVQKFDRRSNNVDDHFLRVVVVDRNGSAITKASFQQYAISVECLPSLDKLETWVLENTRHSRRPFFESGVHGTFFAFAWRYCQCKNELPLMSLMRKAVRLSCFHAIWCSALPLARTSQDEALEHASKAVHKQLAVIVAQGIVDLEIEILSELQNLIFQPKNGHGRQNMLPLWTCLWLLILTYRRTIISYTDFNPSNRADKDSSDLAKHMYDMLVSIYSGLFRPSSPMCLNWLKHEIFELFGQDHRITHTMGTLKTEFDFIFKNDMDRTRIFQEPHDALLRTLILENEKKLNRKAREASQSPPGWWPKSNYIL